MELMKRRGFGRYAWGVLAYSVGVILWGAYVRASGSGAGCGNHWPLCNGEVIPRAPRIETLIEFTHRLTSGLTLVLVLGLVIWGFRVFPRRHPVRLGVTLSGVFVFSEALLGAGLVAFELVAGNASLARAVTVAAHLVNTFLLLAALTLTAWWASRAEAAHVDGQGAVASVIGLSMLGVLFLGMSGAVTALGDTLFPAQSLAEGLQQDLSPTTHFLIRLRVFHPLLALTVAVAVGTGALWLARERPTPATRFLGHCLVGLFGFQLMAGLANVLLLAPVWLQQVHLLLADLLWVALVLLGASALESPPALPAQSL